MTCELCFGEQICKKCIPLAGDFRADGEFVCKGCSSALPPVHALEENDGSGTAVPSSVSPSMPALEENDGSGIAAEPGAVDKEDGGARVALSDLPLAAAKSVTKHAVLKPLAGDPR